MPKFANFLMGLVGAQTKHTRNFLFLFAHIVHEVARAGTDVQYFFRALKRRGEKN